MSINQNPNAILVKIYQICESLLKPNKDEIALQEIQNDLNRYYPVFMSQMNADWEYCTPIQKLIEISQSICHSSDCSDKILWDDDSFNKLALLYNQGYSPKEYQEKISKSEKKNSQSLENYLTALTTSYARLLFVRVDLKYCSDANVGVEQFTQDMYRLRYQIGRKRSCFKHLKGHVWAIEQSSKTGSYHCHLLLIYDGNKKNKDWYAASQVGEKWSEITGNKGHYYNCHDDEYIDRFKQLGTLGIGMIHRSNQIQVLNAIKAAKYLTKPDKYDQHPFVKTKGMRTFGHGTFKLKQHNQNVIG